MRVQKRGNRGFEELKFDKITDRIKNLCVDLNRMVDPSKIALATIKNIYDDIRTEDLDNISANIAESYKLIHPDYSTLAARILISNLHKSTPDCFSDCMALVASKLITVSPYYFGFIADNAIALDNMIVDANDYLFDYFGYKTLEYSYLIKTPEYVLDAVGSVVFVDRDDNVVDPANISMNRRGKPITKIDGRVVQLKAKTVSKITDRPQYLHMRVAIAVSLRPEDSLKTSLEKIKRCYKLISQLYYTHATPTLFNACNKMMQLASCFLQGTHDSIEGINRTKSNSGVISKWAGGEGIHMSNIRSRNQPIKGTNGKSNGIVPQLKIYNETALTFNQGGKRNGAFAIYLEPWHGDIMSFLKLKLNQGAETERARDLFYALWVPDLFVKRLEALQDWSLFSADTAPGLADVYDGMDVCSKCNYCVNKSYAKFILEDSSKTSLEGTAIPNDAQINCEHTFVQQDAFTQLYTRYEEDGLDVGHVSCWELMKAVCEMQRESGTPYILHKDHVNRMSNQKNIGTIKSSNLCVSGETYVLTDKGQFMIKDIVGPATVWNGFEFSDTTIMQTGQNQQLLRIKFSNGATLDCTEYHKFYILVANPDSCCDYMDDLVRVVDAKDLRTGDRITTHKLPTICGGNNKTTDNSWEFLMAANLAIRLEWFANFCDKYGYIVSRTLVCENPHVDDVRLLLTTMGVDCKIRIGAMLMNGGSKSHLIINQTGINHLRSLGIVSKVINEAPIATDCYSIPIVVTNVDIGICSDTYCFNEPKRHLGLFNGILTGNCTEIVEYSSDTSYATCTLASINLKKFLVFDKNHGVTIDYAKLHDVVQQITENLDNVISVNNYPVEECIANARDYRPIGIGVQALADVFALMRIPFLSPEAEKIDLEIFETIYHAALTASCRLATERGAYTEFMGSPASNGILAFDMWRENQIRCGGVLKDAKLFSGRYDFNVLREDIRHKGIRNSLLIAPMPTVSTSQILGNNESFEPFASNIYTKGTLAGKFTVSNRAMITHLIELGLWDDKMKNRVINAGGSVQNIEEIPLNVRQIYLTVWEMKQSELMRRASLRQAFIDQSQSLNIHLADNSDNILRSVFVSGWKYGLKSGSYYIRTRPAATAMKNNIAQHTAQSTLSQIDVAKPQIETQTPITTDNVVQQKPQVELDVADDMPQCTMEEGCLMCGS